MAKEMCEVCAGLLPLVRDGVASEGSCELVREHPASCGECAALGRTMPESAAQPDGGRVLLSIRRRLLAGALLTLAFRREADKR